MFAGYSHPSSLLSACRVADGTGIKRKSFLRRAARWRSPAFQRVAVPARILGLQTFRPTASAAAPSERCAAAARPQSTSAHSSENVRAPARRPPPVKAAASRPPQARGLPPTGAEITTGPTFRGIRSNRDCQHPQAGKIDPAAARQRAIRIDRLAGRRCIQRRWAIAGPNRKPTHSPAI